MLGDEKDIQQNLKDPEGKLSALYGTGVQNLPVVLPYNKLNKLVTAIYIITDIMDKDEPIRLKLRTLGVEILSNINSISRLNLNEKIKTILSFLDIASAVNLVSETNLDVLKKGLLDLSQSINKSNPVNPAWLEEFLLQPSHFTYSNKTKNVFALSKKQRRDDVIKVIKDNGDSATITDIKAKAFGSLVSCSEKTLQRELVSMVKDSVLSKTGEKRWSRYFLVSRD